MNKKRLRSITPCSSNGAKKIKRGSDAAPNFSSAAFTGVTVRKCARSFARPLTNTLHLLSRTYRPPPGAAETLLSKKVMNARGGLRRKDYPRF